MGLNLNSQDMSDQVLSKPTGSRDSSAEPLDLSTTSKVYPFSHPITPERDPSPPYRDTARRKQSVLQSQMSTDLICEPPSIITQPKETWHYRNIKELAKKHHPLLAGEGPQRTPIRVTVPKQCATQLYLGIAVVTEDGEPHPYKVIVPSRTSVNIDDITQDNNLDGLRFDDCSPSDHVHSVTRNIYSLISPTEHTTQCKDVRIHMFNLYQNESITKDMIESRQLRLCRLAFWVCHLENGRYVPISERSLSTIIREQSTTTGSQRRRTLPYDTHPLSTLVWMRTASPNQENRPQHGLDDHLIPLRKLSA